MIARDAGGNERHALFSIDADGSSELRADGRSGRDPRPGRVLARRPRVAFTHTGRNGVDFDVAVVATRRRRAARELAQPGGWSHVIDWSEARHPRAAREHAVRPRPLPRRSRERGADAISRRTTARSPTTRPRLLPDGSVLCACDAGSEFTRLALLRQGAEPEFLTPDDADVEIVALDATRTRRAWVVNRGGASEVWLDGERVAGPAGRRRLGARVRARRLADRHGRPARRLHGRLERRARPTRRTRSAVGGLDRSAFVRPVLDEVESFDGRAHPVPPLRPAGRPGAVLGARRPRVAVPAADGAGDPVPLRAGHHRRRAQRARLTGYGRSYHHLDDVERRLDSVGDLAALGARARRRVRHARRRDGRLLRRLHDDGGDHRAPGALGARREHRRDRQLRDLPRAHGRRTAARCARPSTARSSATATSSSRSRRSARSTASPAR